jgi:hypothetical protein
MLMHVAYCGIRDKIQFHIPRSAPSSMSTRARPGIELITVDEQLLCMVTPETARCLFDRDKVLNPLSIFKMGLEDDDYRDDDPDDIDEGDLLKLTAEEELI